MGREGTICVYGAMESWGLAAFVFQMISRGSVFVQALALPPQFGCRGGIMCGSGSL